MSDNFNKTGIGIDDNTGLPPLGDMYKPPKRDDMVFSQPSGLPPLNPEKEEAAYYADGSIPPFFGESKDNGGQSNGLPPLNGQPVQPQPNSGNVPPQYNAPQNVSPQYAQPQNIQPQYIQAYATRQFSEYDLMVEGGRKIAKVIGIILIVCSLLSLFSSVTSNVDHSQGSAYALGQTFGLLIENIIPQVLNIYLAVCFMKGGNKSRIFFGVIYLIALIAVIAIVVFTVSGAGALLGAQAATIVGLGMGFILLIMLPSIALMVFIIWGTLFSKKVKAYCGALH